MKTKNIFKALALAMLMPAMLLTTACSNDDDVANTSNITSKGYALPVTVNVTRQDDGATRATYNDGTKKLSFIEGDKLLVRGNDNSGGGAGYFAGMLDYDASEGNFSGTIYTENSYSGTADALFTAANSNWVGAALFPKGYESYEFLSISGSGYNTSYSMSYNKAIAATKAAAVEQFSLETAKTYSSGFALSPQNAILNFTITGLTDGAKAVTLKNGTKTMFTGSVTPTSGTAAFALGARLDDPVNLKNVTLTIGGTDIAIISTHKYLTAGKIYNITRSAAPALTYPIALGDATSDYVGSVVTTDGNVYATVAAASAASKTAVAVIAYVGSAGSVDASSASYKGLAIAMSDANSANDCYWCWEADLEAQVDLSCVSKYNNIADAIGHKDGISNTNTLTTDSHTHAAATAAASNNGTAAPTGTSGWFLPSMGQWNLIVQGLASKKAGSDVTTDITTSNNDTYTATNLNSVITDAGGTGFKSSDYHASTLCSDRYAWVMKFGGGKASDYHCFTSTSYVRSVLAF